MPVTAPIAAYLLPRLAASMGWVINAVFEFSYEGSSAKLSCLWIVTGMEWKARLKMMGLETSCMVVIMPSVKGCD